MKRKPIAVVHEYRHHEAEPRSTSFINSDMHLYQVLIAWQDAWWFMNGRYREWEIRQPAEHTTVQSLVDGSYMCQLTAPTETPVYKAWDIPRWKWWQGWTL